ncbi:MULTISPECIES: ABC transporter substrate-binding protein [Paenibacillus]|uniref:ABC transporter substrate-binding protein n=1 Tax=Paenibacillus TaxID=44249 RepID=UPI000367A430|nr:MULTISPECIES: ABC transporter substrate-binding protein [Paenibacillus]MEB4784388.1 ABC transporter substrate-binding protein [Paenibacillus jamilae]MEE4577447.1 ABC transporter substrate-binding protein [Paenibacillus polymyxa]NMP08339.1 ABC transporter substrate-binding protein [Paenibacillus polymyxa]RFU00020.1 iron(3+)-hydroxamate-binding protein yxeB [Paenibacillus jamilae]UNL95520.1 iron(3+)-hydroxamate-binding protein yxeB [Paenibacillus polymyxa]
MRKKSIFMLATLMLVLAVFISACGGNNTGSNPVSSSGDKQESASTGETRSFKTVKGDIEIPAKPQRIVTDFYGGELLSVGANVVGVEPTAFQNPFLTDLLKEKGTKEVGDPTNLEKTLELKPDLIVVMKDTNYEALSKIAPTLYIPYGTTTNIYDTVKLFGDITGEKEKAEQFIATFDKKAAEGRARLKGVIDEKATFGLYELTDKNALWIFGDNAGRGGQAVYNALKLNMPKKTANSKEQTVQLSMEVLPQYDADYMFLTTYDPDKKGTALKQLKSSAVWGNLPAVKNNRVFFNDFDTYYRYDPIAITGQIDMIVDMLVEREKENKAKK